MFKIFKRNNTNTAINFLQKKDVEIANAYRSNAATKLNNGFSASAVRYIAKDIDRNRMIDSSVATSTTDTKYSPERYINREYEIISDDNTKCVVKRLVNFKAVEVSRNLSATINDSFAEIFTLAKTDKGFIIESICAA